MTGGRVQRLLAGAFALALLTSACGDDDDDEAPTTTEAIDATEGDAGTGTSDSIPEPPAPPEGLTPPPPPDAPPAEG